MIHFDLADLRLFINIAETPSMTQGARKSFMSTAAASNRIKKLEELVPLNEKQTGVYHKPAQLYTFERSEDK